MKLFGFDGKLTRLAEKLFDLLLLGIVWLALCIPVVTAGAASAAFYRTVVKAIKKNQGYACREFFRIFCKNFVASTLLFVMTACAGIVLNWNAAILMGETKGDIGLFFICLYYFVFLLLIPFFLYAMAAVTRFDMKLSWIIKLSVYMVFKYLPVTLALYAAVFCFGVLLYQLPILVLVLPGLFLFVVSDFVEKVLDKHAAGEMTLSR